MPITTARAISSSSDACCALRWLLCQTSSDNVQTESGDRPSVLVLSLTIWVVWSAANAAPPRFRSHHDSLEAYDGEPFGSPLACMFCVRAGGNSRASWSRRSPGPEEAAVFCDPRPLIWSE